MRLLIDSRVALWWLAADARLGDACSDQLRSADEVFCSAVTPWELSIKRDLGKITFPDGLITQLASAGFTQLPISAAHAVRASDLPPHHRDPFDRILVAQSQLEALVLVSADRALRPYEIELIDASL